VARKGKRQSRTQQPTPKRLSEQGQKRRRFGSRRKQLAAVRSERARGAVDNSAAEYSRTPGNTGKYTLKKGSDDKQQKDSTVLEQEGGRLKSADQRNANPATGGKLTRNDKTNQAAKTGKQMMW